MKTSPVLDSIVLPWLLLTVALLAGVRVTDATELRFVVPPTIAGHGKRLFDPDSPTELQQFQLVVVEQTPTGTLFLHYRATDE